jgi:hypothetical protein
MCIANTVIRESADSSLLISQFALGQNPEPVRSILTACPLSFLILPFHLLDLKSCHFPHYYYYYYYYHYYYDYYYHYFIFACLFV